MRSNPTNVFLREDLIALLQSIWLSNAAALRASGGNPDYAAGHTMAMVQMAVGMGFGREFDNWRRQMDWDARNEVQP